MFLTAGFAEPFSIVAFNHINIGSSVAEHNACAFGRSPQIMVCVCAHAVDVALFISIILKLLSTHRVFFSGHSTRIKRSLVALRSQSLNGLIVPIEMHFGRNNKCKGPFDTATQKVQSDYQVLLVNSNRMADGTLNKCPSIRTVSKIVFYLVPSDALSMAILQKQPLRIIQTQPKHKFQQILNEH